MRAFTIPILCALWLALVACGGATEPVPVRAPMAATTPGNAANGATATSNGITLRANVVETADLQESVAAGYGIGFSRAAHVPTYRQAELIFRPLDDASATLTTYLLPPEGTLLIFRPLGLDTRPSFEYLASVAPTQWDATLKALGLR